MDETLQLLKEAVQGLNESLKVVQAHIEHQRSQQAEDQWVPLSEAVRALGPAFSESKLREDIAGKYLTYGKHYIDTSHGKRANYAVKVSALRKFYSTPPESR